METREGEATAIDVGGGNGGDPAFPGQKSGPTLVASLTVLAHIHAVLRRLRRELDEAGANRPES